MFLFIFIGVLFVVFIDAKTLKRRHEGRYLKIFRYSPFGWAVLFSFFPFATIYLLRRRRFFQELNLSQADDRPTEKNSFEEDSSLLTRVTDASGVILLWVVVMIWVGIITEGLSPRFSLFATQLGRLVFLSLLSTLFLIYLIYKTTQKEFYGGFFQAVGLKKGRCPFLKLVAVPVLLGVILAVVASWFVLSRQTIPLTPLNEMLDDTKSPQALMSFLGLAVFIAPLLEELIFRGYFFNVIRKFKGRVWSISLITAVFAVLHMGQYWGDWMAIAVVAFLGFVLTFLRDWTDSTISSIVMHYTYNAGVAFIPILIFYSMNFPYVVYQAQYEQLSARAREELLLKSIKTYPRFTQAYNDLAWMYAEENKNLEEALSLVNKALLQDSQNPAYRDTKAEVLYKLKRYRDAVDIEKRLVEENPSEDFYRRQLNKFQKAFRDSFSAANFYESRNVFRGVSVANVLWHYGR